MNNNESNQSKLSPDLFDWESFLHNPNACKDSGLQRIELLDRQEDLSELRWLLAGIQRQIKLYGDAYPDDRYERELANTFGRQTDRLLNRVDDYDRQPELCSWKSYLALKYEIRTLGKQLGAVLTGSDWQTPSKQLVPSKPGTPEEAGFTQEEEGTYMRCYGSETVKDYERAAIEAYYSIHSQNHERSVGFVTTSGMKALELALVVYRRRTQESRPFYYQCGFYGEGVELSRTLLNDPQEMSPADLYRIIEANEPIGCLLVDPGLCWPIRPAVDLDRLFTGLSHHKQAEPLYVIVDRTLTSIANYLFNDYAGHLPAHVVLISVESGIKYLQYGLELGNAGYVVAMGESLRMEREREEWITLLSLLDAGADPVTVRQLPMPDLNRLNRRLTRLNRNAYWMHAFLGALKQEGRITAYYRSVEPSTRYIIGGRAWIGSIFYIQFPGQWEEQHYEAWIDSFVAAAPEEDQFVSGGSFGFDSFRMNAVSEETGLENALRVSVGRAPLAQLLHTLQVLYKHLPDGVGLR